MENQKLRTSLLLGAILYVCFIDSIKAQTDILLTHADNKTTAILNFIAGKEELPDKYKAELEIKILYQMLLCLEDNSNNFSDKRKTPSRSIKLKKNLVQYLNGSREELIEYWQSDQYTTDIIYAYYWYRLPYSKKTVKDKTSALLSYFISSNVLRKDTTVNMNKKEIKKLLVKQCNNLQFMEDRNLNGFSLKKLKAIWLMNQRYGNPKVRFSDNFSAIMSYGQRALYRIKTNTIYLGISYDRSPQMYISDWIAELSHAQQNQKYTDSVITVRLEREADYLDLLQKTSPYSMLVDFQRTFYFRSDSLENHPFIEYEAHKIIEPKLWDEYNDLLK